MALFDDVRAAAIYSAYRSLIAGNSDGLVQPWDVYSRQLVEFSSEYLWRALRQAEKDGYLENLELGSKYFVLTDQGIKDVENQERWYRESFERVCGRDPVSLGAVPQWLATDDLGSLKEAELNELRDLLAKCREVIAAARVTQMEKSQADQHVKAAQEIAEAPTPKLRAIWQLIRPFTESFLSELAKRILGILLPGS
jgi:hypothetical protein